jgi:hypothetical protein
MTMIAGIAQGIDCDLDRLIQPVQFPAGVGVGLKIVVRGKNLAGNLTNRIVRPGRLQTVNCQTESLTRIGHADKRQT